MRSRSNLAIPAILFLATAFAVAPVRAGALYFEKVPVATGSEATCMTFASDVARTLQFAGVHRNASEVAGVKDGAYVALTCVGRGGQSAIGIVMSTSDSFDVARSVGHAAADRFKGLRCTDTC